MSEHCTFVGVRTGALALLACAALLGCGGPGDDAPAQGEGTAQDAAGAAPSGEAASGGTPERGDWLVVHMLSDPENLNPVTSTDAGSTQVLSWIFPSLLTLDNETLEQRPLLASEMPQISEDKLQYTFRIREGVTFSDGKPLTADDVLLMLKTVKNPYVNAPHLRNYFESVRAAELVDPMTLRIDLRQPYFRNDLMLGGLSGLPRHHYDPENLLGDVSVADLDAGDAMPADKKEKAERFGRQFNESFNRNPLGSGAYVLEDPARDIATGEQITLRRRAAFWAPDDPDLGDAWVNRVVFRIVNDQEAALASFKRGDIDRLGLTPIQHNRPDTQNASFLERAAKQEHATPTYTYVGWNARNPIFADARVRRALSHFVDKKSLVQTVLLGLGEPVEGPVFYERPEYDRSLAPWPYDPEKGKALLAEAGWKDTDGDGVLDKEIDGKRVPLRFELITNSGNDVRRLTGLAIVDPLKRAGIDASFRQVDFSILLSKLRALDFDAAIGGWSMGVTPPDLYQLWHSSQAVEGGSNHVSFKNPEVDKLLETYREEFDPAKRKEMIDRVQRILYEEQPYTFLFMGKAVDTWSRRFRGVVWYEKSKGTDMARWWVPRGEQRYTE